MQQKDHENSWTLHGRQMELDQMPEIVPLLPVRNLVLFPLSIVPVTVGREGSRKLLEEANRSEGRLFGVLTQRDSEVEEPQEIDLYSVGSLATASKQIRVKDNHLAVVVQGLQRFRVVEVIQNRPYLLGRVQYLEDIPPVLERSKVEAMKRSIQSLFQLVVGLSPGLSANLADLAAGLENPGHLVDFVATVVPSLSISQRQDFLETLDVWKRMEKLHVELAREAEILELKGKIQSQVHDEVGKNQREYYLR
jgi:ATP-dependent Lon protease